VLLRQTLHGGVRRQLAPQVAERRRGGQDALDHRSTGEEVAVELVVGKDQDDAVAARERRFGNKVRQAGMPRSLAGPPKGFYVAWWPVTLRGLVTSPVAYTTSATMYTAAEPYP